MEFLYLLSLIFIYSLVQSIFGIGLLVFGTPTLLLLDYSYSEALWILIPPSIALSFSQIIFSRHLISSGKEIYLFIIPPLMVSLVFIIQMDYVFDIKKIIGVFLLLVVLLRTNSFSEKVLRNIVRNYKRLSYSLIGFIHGVSNLGGGPLSAMMSILHDDKDKVRANIAFVYFVLALSQLLVLFLIDKNSIGLQSIAFIIAAVTVNMLFGKHLSESIDKKRYDIFINAIVVFFAFICLI